MTTAPAPTSSDALLVLNAGSSSIKYALYAATDDTPLLHKGQIERIGLAPQHSADGETTALPLGAEATHAEAMRWLTTYLATRQSHLNVVAAGHRVVHGGRDFDAPVRITPDNIALMEALSPLAPAHQPHNLAGIAAAALGWPGIPQVACFDSAFHRSQPRLAQMFAIPRDLTDEGVLRYGFHGLSYDYIASQLPRHLNAEEQRRVLVLHLGNGASICAMRDLKSVATTMGFTALDGLMMGRRCGDLDPGVVFHLSRSRGLDINQIESLLSDQSGLLGVSGISSDMRDLLASDAPEAAEAVDLFVYTVARLMGGMTAALAGLDAVVFTGGIGENAAEIRARIGIACGWLGVEIDAEANAAGQERISPPDSKIAVLALKTNEERVIAQHTWALVSQS